MAKKMIADMRPGEPVNDIFLLRGCELRTARNDSLYLDLDLRDRSGAIKGRMWDASEALYRALTVDDLVRVKGKVGLFRNENQLNVAAIAKADGAQVDLTDFLPVAARPVAEMEKEMRAILAREIEEPDLRRLVDAFLDDEKFMADFRACPAAVSYHHAYLGGLLDHTLSMLKMAQFVAAHYPPVDRDFLLAATFFHDMGKTRELIWTRSFQFSDSGQLVGHIVIGVVMLEEKVRELDDFPRAKLDRLSHDILAHHGEYEFGSPKLPMTAEAIALHYIDNMDAKLRDFTEAVDADINEDSNWTTYQPRLQRRLYKG